MTIIYIIIGFLGLNVMIMVHELGHFVACKINHVHVESLSVGFGPAILSWGKHETKYRICLIPVGGSTKMRGHEDIKNAIDKGERKITETQVGSLFGASHLKRILIYIAGPIANILFAIVCFTVLQSLTVITPDSEPRIVLSKDYPSLYSTPCPAEKAGLKTGDLILSVNGKNVYSYSELSNELKLNKDSVFVTVETDKGTYTISPENGVFGILPYKEAVVGSVDSSSNEKKAGLKKSDVIISANGNSVHNMFDLLKCANSDSVMELVVLRAGKTKTLSFEVQNKTLNFTLKSKSIKKAGENFSTALSKALRECNSETVQFFESILSIFKGQNKVSQTIGGSIYASENIGMLTTKAFDASFNTGIRVLLYIMATVSMSLAVVNFLPITALDGGMVLINLIELVTKRSFSPKTYIIFQVLGLVTMFVVIPVIKFLY